MTFVLDAPVSHYRRPFKIREIKKLITTSANVKYNPFNEMNKKTYLQCIPLCFGVSSSLYWFFWLYCITTATPFKRRPKQSVVSQAVHTICVSSQLLFYSKCSRFTVCFTYSDTSLSMCINQC